MNCRLAHDLLQQSLDGTPIESPEWLAHLRDCAQCRTLTSAGWRLQDGLRLLVTPAPPPQLTERIVERLLLDHRRTQSRLRRRWAIALGLAAGLLLILAVIPSQRTPPAYPTVTADRQQPTPEKTASADRQPTLSNPSMPSLPEPATELREVFAELSHETAKASEGLSEGLEPVATSARRAVDLFLRELPMETEPNDL